MVELLSPAGDMESFIAAVQSGADAVYMGLDKYNARQMSENFTKDKYIWCINYAHIYGVKVYLTLNTLLYDEEIYEVLDALNELYKEGLDAVIVQDIGLFSVIKKTFKDLPIHASTQMTAYSLKQVKYLESLGFDRVVLARELTFDEIKYIKENVNVELEVFIHGALCVSYSGQCLMSSMIGRRSGNRGKCAGTCRLKYDMYENEKKIKSGHLISKKDIYGIDYVKKLASIGITSLKIEGRGKTKEYVALVSRKYRKIIDGYEFDINDEKELLQIFNRTSKSSGYFDMVPSKESITIDTAKNTGLVLGKVIGTNKKMIKIKLLEDINMHDGIEVNEKISTIVTCIRDENFKLLNAGVEKSNIVYIGDFSVMPKIGDTVYKTSSKSLIEEQNEFLKNVQRKVKINVEFDISLSEKIKVKLENTLSKKTFNFEFDYIPELSKTHSINCEDIKNVFSKNKDSYFDFNITKVKIKENIFIPISILNKIRKESENILILASKTKRKSNLSNENVSVIKRYIKANIYKGKKEEKNSLFIYSFDKNKIKEYLNYKCDYMYINISDICKNAVNILDSIKKDVYIYLPNIILKNLEFYIDNNIDSILSKSNVKGILIGNYNYIEKIDTWKKKYNLTIVADYTLNINNAFSAIFYKQMGVDVICLSPEIEERQANIIDSICRSELVCDMVTAMTSRFCLIKSFSSSCNCTKNKYKLIDQKSNVYYVITDNIDCVTKLVRKIPYKIQESSSCIKRKCII